MRSEQLEYVAAIARLGSFRRAADELHISQPALSSTVRNLERELGISLLERGRGGAQLSEEGRELLPLIAAAIDAIDRVRTAADQKHHVSRMVRLATVNAGTVPLLTASITRFRSLQPDTQVEVVGAQEDAINSGLREGGFDLGLVTCLAGDDMPPDLDATRLLRGRAVVCLSPDDPLADREAVGIEELAATPLIMMRRGYLMHRFVHRLLRERGPLVAFSTDGGEMGKLMVAEGLGVTVLPDFSVVGDPLVRQGAIVWRPIAGDRTCVDLVLRRRRSDVHPSAIRELHRIFVEEAAARGIGLGSSASPIERSEMPI